MGTKFAVVAGGLDGELGVAEGDGFPKICHQLMPLAWNSRWVTKTLKYFDENQVTHQQRLKRRAGRSR